MFFQLFLFPQCCLFQLLLSQAVLFISPFPVPPVLFISAVPIPIVLFISAVPVPADDKVHIVRVFIKWSHHESGQYLHPYTQFWYGVFQYHCLIA